MSNTAPAIEIALYGTPEHGHGYIVRIGTNEYLNSDTKPDSGGMELHPEWSLTDTIWRALNAAEGTGRFLATATVRIFAPGGETMATQLLGERRTAGDLSWSAAPIYRISVEEAKQFLAEQKREGRK